MTLTPELLADLRKRAETATADARKARDAAAEDVLIVTLALLDRIAELTRLWNEQDDALRDQREAFQVAKAEMQGRITELERVAKAVDSITDDLARNGYGADCPYTSQEEAAELLAIIRKGR